MHPEHMMEIDEVTAMALTPEDVVNKRFNPTKFREGYDQDEVDDFLDEVVVELRRLNQENEELRQRLVAGEARINELQRSGGAAAAGRPQQAAPAAPVAAPRARRRRLQADRCRPMDPSNTNNLLQLARRLHEEHVREGMEKRDALIAEGHAAAARVVSEAAAGAARQLGELEQARARAARSRAVEQEKLRASSSRTQSSSARSSELRVRAGVPREAARLHRGAAARARDHQRADHRIRLRRAEQPHLSAAAARSRLPRPPATPGRSRRDYAAYPQPTDYPGFAAGN